MRGRYKLIVDERDGDRARLFDLESDPREEVDLAALHPEICDELREITRGIRSNSLAQEPGARNTEIFERLRAMGYIED